MLLSVFPYEVVFYDLMIPKFNMKGKSGVVFLQKLNQ